MDDIPASRTAPPLLVDLIRSLDGGAAGDGWPGWRSLQSDEYLDWLPEARAFAGGLQLLEHAPTQLPAPPGTAWEG